jgi:uncharacterized protein (UPF0332 family)
MKTIAEARLLLDKGFLNTCVNRLYYACFFAVSALLLTEGYSSAKHSGLRALFDRHWVKQRRVSVEIGRIYRRLFVNRQRGDHGRLRTVHGRGGSSVDQGRREIRRRN